MEMDSKLSIKEGFKMHWFEPMIWSWCHELALQKVALCAYIVWSTWTVFILNTETTIEVSFRYHHAKT